MNPSKDNIRDAWASVETRGGSTFLYLAFARETASGTTFVTFELNRDGRLWNNGRARVPCRQTGDILISYEPHGNTVSVLVQRWVTDTTDPDSGCAATGHLDPVSGLTADVDVQGAVNPSRIANSLPGAYGATIPEERFGEAAIDLGQVLDGAAGGCFAFTSAWMHSRSSTSESSNMQDYVAPLSFDLRRCAASGTKFLDRNANGIREPDDPGIPRFVIFADYDDDGVRDAGEPFTITDADGRYTLDDIRPPDGTYTLREALRRSTPGSWTCSYPNAGTPGGFGGAGGTFPCGWGPISVAEEPYARDRDFGNWVPARLTVRKKLSPPGDPGRFDLVVNGVAWLTGAGDGATETRRVPPGVYTVQESAAPGTDASDYRSTVWCKRGPRPVRRASGPVFTPLTLTAGQRWVCTFRNVRLGAPAIAIDKTGPASAPTGATLNYTLAVSNPGDLPFPDSAVEVTDAGCDEPPALERKLDAASAPDGTPDTLDPGDQWIYGCSHRTPEPGAECRTSSYANSATASGTAGGQTVRDESAISTVLTCPEPPSDLEPEPGPGGSGTAPSQTVPPGPEPPAAGVAGRASLGPLERCLRRGSRVTIRGRRIAAVRVSVGGARVRGLIVRPLRHRVTIVLARTFEPGSHRVTARIRFETGSGTPSVVETRRVRVCAVAAPRFTG